MSNEVMVKFENVSKKYILGAIGATTLRDELQRFTAKLRGTEDPTKKLDEKGLELGKSFFALKDISVEIKAGETVGIIGHNGAGKSTLLKVLSRVTAPTEGDIWLNGRIASMLEVGTGFHPELTGRENIYMNGAILGMTKQEISRKIEEIIDFSECRKFIDTPVKRYSSGMYVKLAFSIAAHLDSEIMVMDEVLAVGDMKFQQKCLGRMDNAAKQEGRTVLYVSHNMNTIRQLCTRCIVLDHGSIVYDGDVEGGIQKYMEGNDMRFNKHIDYTDTGRLTNTTGKVRFCSAYVHDEDNQYCCDDCMHVSFDLDVKQAQQDMRMMMILFSRDGTQIGKTETDNFSLKEGQRTLKIAVPFDHLAAGEYYFEIDLLKRNGIGAYEKFDGISNTLPFCIENEDVFGVKGEEWKSNYWGHIMLEGIKVCDE